MRVLYLTYNPNLGSTTRTLQDWLLLGKEVGLHSSVCVRERGLFTTWLENNAIPFKVDPMAWPNKWNPLKNLLHAMPISRWAKRHNIDLIHCNEHDVYPFGVFLGKMLRRPVVCHVRFRVSEGFCKWAFQQKRQPAALLWTSKQQQIDCTTAVDGSVPTCKQKIISLGLNLEHFGVLSSEREATRRLWGIAPHEIVLGSASALRPHKRIEDFIQIVDKLAQKYPNIVGVLAGDAPAGDEDYREKILQRLSAVNLGHRFRWLGNVAHIEPFYHAIDIFVSTSEYETFGMSVCEAMACRRPVVGYCGGSVQEVVGDTGLIVRTGDLPALINEVDKLVCHVELREELGNRGRQRVEHHFNPSRSLAALKAIYESILIRRTETVIEAPHA